MDNARFILWDPKDGDPRHDEEGSITSAGLVGPIGADNAFLAAYAAYPDARRPRDLQVGERIRGVRYSLSGSVGSYDVHRVR